VQPVQNLSGGAKCLFLGKQQYFAWDNASQNTKKMRYPKNLGGHGPWLHLYITDIISDIKLFDNNMCG